jgi:hypothetical protein
MAAQALPPSSVLAATPGLASLDDLSLGLVQQLMRLLHHPLNSVEDGFSCHHAVPAEPIVSMLQLQSVF